MEEHTHFVQDNVPNKKIIQAKKDLRDKLQRALDQETKLSLALEARKTLEAQKRKQNAAGEEAQNLMQNFRKTVMQAYSHEKNTEILQNMLEKAKRDLTRVERMTPQHRQKVIKTLLIIYRNGMVRPNKFPNSARNKYHWEYQNKSQSWTQIGGNGQHVIQPELTDGNVRLHYENGDTKLVSNSVSIRTVIKRQATAAKRQTYKLDTDDPTFRARCRGVAGRILRLTQPRIRTNSAFNLHQARFSMRVFQDRVSKLPQHLNKTSEDIINLCHANDFEDDNFLKMVQFVEPTIYLDQDGYRKRVKRIHAGKELELRLAEDSDDDSDFANDSDSDLTPGNSDFDEDDPPLPRVPSLPRDDSQDQQDAGESNRGGESKRQQSAPDIQLSNLEQAIADSNPSSFAEYADLFMSVFKEADKNNDESLTKTELRNYLKSELELKRTLGVGPRIDNLEGWQSLYNAMDEDENKTFDPLEFAIFSAHKVLGSQQIENEIAIRKYFKEKDGTVFSESIPQDKIVEYNSRKFWVYDMVRVLRGKYEGQTGVVIRLTAQKNVVQFDDGQEALFKDDMLESYSAVGEQEGEEEREGQDVSTDEEEGEGQDVATGEEEVVNDDEEGEGQDVATDEEGEVATDDREGEGQDVATDDEEGEGQDVATDDEPERAFNVDDRVRVLRGKYEGQTGVVIRLTAQKNMVQLDDGQEALFKDDMLELYSAAGEQVGEEDGEEEEVAADDQNGLSVNGYPVAPAVIERARVVALQELQKERGATDEEEKDDATDDEPERAFNVGVRVRVLRGKYEGQTGVVIRLTAQKNVVQLDDGQEALFKDDMLELYSAVVPPSPGLMMLNPSPDAREYHIPSGAIAEMVANMSDDWASSGDELNFAEESESEELGSDQLQFAESSAVEHNDSGSLEFAESSAVETDSDNDFATQFTSDKTSSGLEFAESSAVESDSARENGSSSGLGWAESSDYD